MKKLVSLLTWLVVASVALAQNQNVTVDPRTRELKAPNPLYIGNAGSTVYQTGSTLDARNATVLLPSTPSTVSNVVSVPTLNALRGTSVSGLPNGAYITLAGYATPNDGAGGTFVYVSSSSATDNTGTVVQPNVGAGRFLRLFNNELRPEWFGAKGTGTDDDTIPLQATITAAQFGMTIILDRVYATSSELSLAGKSHITITGNTFSDNGGNATTSSGIRYTGGGARSVLWLVGANYITLRDIELYAAVSSPPKTLLSVGRSVSNNGALCRFERVKFTGYATKALVYDIAQECTYWDNPIMQLLGGGAKYTYYTSQDDDLSVSPGNFESNTDLCKWFSHFYIVNAQTQAGSASIYINGRASTGDITFRDGFISSAAGSHIQINVVNDADDSAFGQFIFDSVRMERSGSNIPDYGIKLTATAGTVSPVVGMMSITNLNVDASAAVLYGADGVFCRSFTMYNLKNFTDLSPVNVDVDILENSTFSASGAGLFRVRTSMVGCNVVYSGTVSTAIVSGSLISETEGDTLAWSGTITAPFFTGGIKDSYLTTNLNANTHVITSVGGIYGYAGELLLATNDAAGVITFKSGLNVTAGTVSAAQNWTFVGSITTGNPTGGTATALKVGDYSAGAPTVDGKIRIQLGAAKYDIPADLIP